MAFGIRGIGLANRITFAATAALERAVDVAEKATKARVARCSEPLG
jgi:hypothetical protein